MAKCPNCSKEHSHDELTLDKSHSTKDSTHALLKCPSCGEKADYTE